SRIVCRVVVVVVSPSSKVLGQVFGSCCKLIVAAPCLYIVRPSFLASVILEKVRQQVHQCEEFVVKVLGQFLWLVSHSYRLNLSLVLCVICFEASLLLLWCYFSSAAICSRVVGSRALCGCQDGSGNGLTKTYLITNLRDRHCKGEAQAITKHALLTHLVIFERTELDHVGDLMHAEPDGFTLSVLDRLFSKGSHTVKSIPPKCRLGFSRVLRVALDKVICKPDDVSCWVSFFQLVRETLAESAPLMLDLDGEDLELTARNLKQCKRKVCDGHYTAAMRVLSSTGVAPYNNATLQELKTKHPFMSAPSLPDSHIDHHPLIASHDVVLDRIKSLPRGTSCGRDGLRAQHLMDCLSGEAVAIFDELVSSITQVVNLFLEGKCPTMLGEYIASAPLTPIVKPGGGILPIAVGTIWRRLVSKVSATMIGHSLDGYLDGLQFGVGVPEGGEAILHAVNRLVEDRGDDVGLSMLLVDFQNAFNLSSATLALPDCTTESTPYSHVKGCSRAWYLNDGTIVGDTLVVGKVLELITEDGPRCGLHLNVDKTEIFWPKEDPRSRLEGIFPPNISRPLHEVKLLGGPVSVDVDFGSALVMKRVSRTIGLLDAVAKINDPQCELLLIRACAGVSKLCFAMRTCSPCVFESAQLSFDMALRSALERIVTASGPGFGDWQWRLATLPFPFGGLGVYSACDVLNYAFIASRLQSAALQTKLLRYVGIVTSGSTFDDALCVFNNAMEIDFLRTPIGLMEISKGRAYFGLALVSISGLGQTMNGKTYRCVLCYRLGVPLFFVSKPCSACSKVFTGDVYEDHAVSCAGVIGIKHRHNTVRDTLIDICSRPGISAGKEVDIGLRGDGDKALRPADMLLYSWEGGLDVCVDSTGSSPLTQTGFDGVLTNIMRDIKNVDPNMTGVHILNLLNTDWTNVHVLFSYLLRCQD
ncbi:hypothetical protein Tco_1110658, partial [Tanacetum coccineum]